MGLLFVIFLIAAGIIAGMWGYNKLIKPCGCQ